MCVQGSKIMFGGNQVATGESYAPSVPSVCVAASGNARRLPSGFALTSMGSWVLGLLKGCRAVSSTYISTPSVHQSTLLL